VLSNAVRYDLLLKYFWVCIGPEQLRELEEMIVRARIEEME
jgi:hypothetical protein